MLSSLQQKKALLKWRNQKITNENLNNISQKEIHCLFQPFVKFTILRKNIDLENYRIMFTQKTKKQWNIATINDIFNADLVW
jgi:hypothetical protein